MFLSKVPAPSAGRLDRVPWGITTCLASLTQAGSPYLLALQYQTTTKYSYASNIRSAHFYSKLLASLASRFRGIGFDVDYVLLVLCRVAVYYRIAVSAHVYCSWFHWPLTIAFHW